MTKREKVLLLFAVTEHSDAEIAALVGCPPTYIRTVRQRERDPATQTKWHRATWERDPDYRERRRAAWRRSSAKKYRAKLAAQGHV